MDILILIPIIGILYLIVHIVRTERKFNKQTKATFDEIKSRGYNDGL